MPTYQQVYTPGPVLPAGGPISTPIAHKVTDLYHIEEGTTVGHFDSWKVSEVKRIMTTVYRAPDLSSFDRWKCNDVYVDGNHLTFYGSTESGRFRRDTELRGTEQFHLRKLELQEFLYRVMPWSMQRFDVSPSQCKYYYTYSDMETFGFIGEQAYKSNLKELDIGTGETAKWNRSRILAKVAVKAIQLLEKLHDAGLAFGPYFGLVHQRGGLLDERDHILPSDIGSLRSLIDVNAVGTQLVEHCRAIAGYMDYQKSPAELLMDHCPTRIGDMYKLSEWLMLNMGVPMPSSLSHAWTHKKLMTVKSSVEGGRAATIFNTFHTAMFDKSASRNTRRPNYDYWIRWFRKLEHSY